MTMTDLTERKRLWIGNLDERLSEANLLKILKRYGEITQFDFLFHTSGPKQGKPRGYCFVSFKTVEEAVGAIAGLDGKLALGKKLLVKWAHAQNKIPSEPVKIKVETNCELNPEKLPSVLGGQSSSTSTRGAPSKGDKTSRINMKIKAIENKLKQMSQSAEDFKVTPVHQTGSATRSVRQPSRLSKKPYVKR